MIEGKEGLLFDILYLFPGVPVFFFISGFLISKSFEQSPSQLAYLKNRVLRIYPALVVCVLVNIAMVWTTGYFNTHHVAISKIALLLLAKSTFFQFYNPDFMRQFGDGVLNGSLWTICVELQFYLIIPVLYKILNGKGLSVNRVLVAFVALFLCANVSLYLFKADYSQFVVWKLYRVSFAPWVYMFLVGVYFQRNFDSLMFLLRPANPLVLLCLYVTVFLALQNYGALKAYIIDPMKFFFLVIVVFKCAYYLPDTYGNILNGNDISYGIYIWHMPVVNHMIHMGYNQTYGHAFVAITLSIVLAYFSWVFIEKPVLGFKNFSLRRVK
jgi:peptidoglycan/LPS O-acetylase OafA/YrhL